ncbi:MAG: WD40 repeat domain-containing protein [Cytophagales bacterium]|nr:WD40 repeat domain-containing protein [Cytophagales bacterium]
MAKIKVEKVHALKGHRGAIYSLASISNTSQFVSAGEDGFVVLWDTERSTDGQLLAKVPHSIYAMNFVEEKQLLIVGHNYEGIHLIDIKTKKEVATKKLQPAPIFDIQCFENSIFVAFGDGSVWKLSLEKLEVLQRWKFTEKSARSLAVRHDGSELAIGYSDHSIRIIDLKTNELSHELKGHTNSVFSVTYSPDHKHLLSVSRDATLKSWNILEEYKLEESVVAHMYTINHLTYSQNGKYFATCSVDKSIKIWDASKLKLLKVIDKGRHAGHGTSVNKLLWDTHNNHLISGSDDRSISTWNLTFKTPE